METLQKKNLPKLGLRHWCSHPINLLIVFVLSFLIIGVILIIRDNLFFGRWLIAAGLICSFIPLGTVMVFGALDKMRKFIK